MDGTGGIGIKPLCFILNNGSSVCMDDKSKNQLIDDIGVNVNTGSGSSGMIFYIDVNGSKQPNVLGKDTFIVVALEDHFVPAGNSKTPDEIRKDCSKTGRGYYCLSIIKNNGWSMLKF